MTEGAKLYVFFSFICFHGHQEDHSSANQGHNRQFTNLWSSFYVIFSWNARLVTQISVRHAHIRICPVESRIYALSMFVWSIYYCLHACPVFSALPITRFFLPISQEVLAIHSITSIPQPSDLVLIRLYRVTCKKKMQ